jgi:FtsH-binding integral membrane protein
MEKNKMKMRVLRGLSLVFVLMAAATVIPFGGAREPSILGYRALCPFMPVSTVISLYLFFTLHRYLGSLGRKD